MENSTGSQAETDVVKAISAKYQLPEARSILKKKKKKPEIRITCKPINKTYPNITYLIKKAYSQQNESSKKPGSDHSQKKKKKAVPLALN